MIRDHLPKPISGIGITLRDLGDIVIYTHSDDITAVANMEEGNAIDQLSLFIDQVATRFPIVMVDVGCNYGVQLCRMAHHIKQVTKNFKIIALDPGRAAELLPYTLLKNNIADDVEFIPAAAWKESGVVEVFSEEGNSLNNRIVKGGATIGWIAPAVTLAQIFDECELDPAAPIFAKIDTQGADLEVLLGAGDYLSRLVCVTELTPWACGDRIDVTAFIENLKRSHWIYNLSPLRDICEPVDDSAEFVKTVYETAPYWTDILCVPRRFSWLLDSMPAVVAEVA